MKYVKVKITKEKAVKLFNLVEEWTACEIKARLGRFDNLEFADYAHQHIEKEDEIRRLLFGSDCLVQLNELFGNLVESKEQKIARIKKENRTKMVRPPRKGEGKKKKKVRRQGLL